MSTTTSPPAPPSRTTQTTLPANWSVTHRANSMFPTEERSVLQDDSNWIVWLATFTSAASYCKCAGLIHNTIPYPSDADEQTIWWEANDFLKTMLIKCVAPKLVVKIMNAENFYDAFSILQNEYGSQDIASAVHWFSMITEKQHSDTPIQDHITRFQSGLNNLTKCGFALPEAFAAGFFVASLWRDPSDASSWFAWAESFKLRTTSTLQGAIHDIQAVSRLRQTASMNPSSSQLQSALVTVEREHRRNGRVFCTNPACPSPSSHAIDKCRSPGGGAYSAGGKNQKRGGRGAKKDKDKDKDRDKDRRKGKSNDKANMAEEESSKTVQTHFVADCAEYDDDFDAYLVGCRSSSVSHTPSPTSVEHAYVIDSRKSTIVIDSGATSNIHSQKDDFSSYHTVNQMVTGFASSTAKITGRGTLTIDAHLPNGHRRRINLKNTAHSGR